MPLSSKREERFPHNRTNFRPPQWLKLQFAAERHLSNGHFMEQKLFCPTTQPCSCFFLYTTRKDLRSFLHQFDYACHSLKCQVNRSRTGFFIQLSHAAIHWVSSWAYLLLILYIQMFSDKLTYKACGINAIFRNMHFFLCPPQAIAVNSCLCSPQSCEWTQ